MVERRAPRRRCGVRVGPTRLEGLPAAWAGAVAAVKAKWPVAGGGISQMILGRWGRGVTSVEPVAADGAVTWDATAAAAAGGEANRFRFDVELAAAPRPGRPERGVFFSVLYGFQEQGRGKDLVKLEEIGTAMISLEECCWEMQLQQQQQQKRGAPHQQLVVVPIRVRKDGWASDAILYVNVELVDLNSPSENISRTVSLRESKTRPIPTPTMHNNRKSSLETGGGTYQEDDEAIGGWESRELTSRDGETKLKTAVFFASIDQRDDSAGGESACTALVAVLAAALHANHPTMPTRPELDALIRDGSSEWRRLCDDDAHMALFPNRHFDLDTVLAASTATVAVQLDRAFVGFFQPESFASLSGAMSFDDIWREIAASADAIAAGEPGRADVYIVSWNDHFFVLKVEGDCYHVIDTLGERLFEGCDKAYMLRFDASSEMRLSLSPEEEEGEVIVTGKDCCREFIKRFLAAIPLREELEMEKKGCADAAPHRRLQIEFHFTVLKQQEQATR
uniref:C2 NT-type domain-containing protein n=1 Tax=Leersia perrieri TaxID=77586 RepID=A0A0D9UXV3_9ORYZ